MPIWLRDYVSPLLLLVSCEVSSLWRALIGGITTSEPKERQVNDNYSRACLKCIHQSID